MPHVHPRTCCHPKCSLRPLAFPTLSPFTNFSFLPPPADIHHCLAERAGTPQLLRVTNPPRSLFVAVTEEPRGGGALPAMQPASQPPARGPLSTNVALRAEGLQCREQHLQPVDHSGGGRGGFAGTEPMRQPTAPHAPSPPHRLQGTAGVPGPRGRLRGTDRAQGPPCGDCAPQHGHPGSRRPRLSWPREVWGQLTAKAQGSWSLSSPFEG